MILNSYYLIDHDNCCTSHSTLYWSDVGSYPKVGKSSMDGSSNSTSTVLNSTYHNDKLVFTLDRSQQVLYWIRGLQSCCLERSNSDGTNRSIVYCTGYYRGRCKNYYFMRSPYFQAMDFFGGAVYTYSPHYNRHIYKTTAESRSNIASINNNYMSYICSSYSAQGMKVISRQRQLQSKQFALNM